MGEVIPLPGVPEEGEKTAAFKQRLAEIERAAKDKGVDVEAVTAAAAADREAEDAAYRDKLAEGQAASQQRMDKYGPALRKGGEKAREGLAEAERRRLGDGTRKDRRLRPVENSWQVDAARTSLRKVTEEMESGGSQDA